MKKVSGLLLTGLLAIAVIGLYTGYNVWLKSSAEAELKKVQNDFSDYNNEILRYQNLNVLEAINAKQTLNEFQNEIVNWSDIVKKIRNTVPEGKNGDLVDILSYSGSGSNQITMSMKTKENSDTPYFDVAEVIEAFDESNNFVDTFIPAITSGSDERGSEILTFTLTTNFVEEQLVAETQPSQQILR